MEINYSSIAVTACIFLSIGVWKLLDWIWFAPRKVERRFRDQGFTGDSYRIPWLSFTPGIFAGVNEKPLNLHDNDISGKVLCFDIEKIKNYGKYSFSWIFTNLVVILRDPELLKEVTLKNYQFQKVPHNSLTGLLMKGISSLDGEQWTKHRKIISPAFHIEKVKLMVQAFYASTSEVLKEWEEMASSKGSFEIDVWPYLSKLTSDVISRTAFGSNYKEGQEIFELQREQAEHYSQIIASQYRPGLRFIPSKRTRRMQEICSIVNQKIRCIVEARMKEMKASGDDFLSLLLESNFKEVEQSGSKASGISIEDVIEECKLLYVAGQETTAVLLVWTMILLARHPEWQNRAREEVFQVFGNHQVPDYGTISQLKIVTMILYESLRLYTPAPAFMRVAVEETKLGKFTIPKGTFIYLPIISVHHDREVWGDDVLEFNPERFAGGPSNATKGGRFGFFPFSWGPRICAGQNFAMTEAKTAISMILRRFSFEISPLYMHHPGRSALSTTRPNQSAQLILRKL